MTAAKRASSRRVGVECSDTRPRQNSTVTTKDGPCGTRACRFDLHRRRSVIVRKTADGELLSKVQIDNDPMALAAAIAVPGPEPEMVVEAISAASGRAAREGGLGVGSRGRLPSRRAPGCRHGRRPARRDRRPRVDAATGVRLRQRPPACRGRPRRRSENAPIRRPQR